MKKQSRKKEKDNGVYRSTFTISVWIKYFLFCQTFEKLFIVCAKIFINLKVELSGIEPKAFHDLKVK